MSTVRVAHRLLSELHAARCADKFHFTKTRLETYGKYDSHNTG